MFVCICHAVTDRDIQGRVQDGARSMRELRLALGVGTQCGKCARQVRAILRDETRGAPSVALAPATLAA